ncbi:MAG: hypothetical protein IJF22_02840 [Clostridia bacterium]|nr:hypothetical protein [Clostridia bacterium]
MLDWLGLTPLQTQILGWVLIVMAVAFIAVLFWIVITKGKHWKRFERNVKVINSCEEQISQMQNETKAEEKNNSRKN